MKRITLHPNPFPTDQIPKKLEENRILINQYAAEYFSHPGFSTEQTRELNIAIASLREIGCENGATLNDIFQQIPKLGLQPCPASTGLFLRLGWKDQPQSQNSVLSGTHHSPDQAVMVLSELLEQDDAFPKGLYLRNVAGQLWLRGYVCDTAYRFPGDALFAFETYTPSFSGL